MFSLDEKDGTFTLLVDGSPVNFTATSREELYELASSILHYLEMMEERGSTAARSGKWSKIRNEFVTEYPKCAACNSEKMINCHHIEPFSENPERELDKNNLISLCFSCHFIFGHLKSWISHNPNVVQDSAWYNQKMVHRPRNNDSE
jgi:hypothetical protein